MLLKEKMPSTVLTGSDPERAKQKELLNNAEDRGVIDRNLKIRSSVLV